MREAFGDLWTFPADYRIVTTNGFVKQNGHAVMGRGCAKEATQRYPLLTGQLGQRLKEQGNIVLFWSEYSLLTFPVKHNWFERADPQLIARSVQQLLQCIELLQLEHEFRFVLPRPGCGNGQLLWNDVKPLVTLLPDNVYVITNEPR